MKNDWEKKTKCLGLPIKQAKSLPLQCAFGRVALPSVRSDGPTHHLHISCICSIWKILHFYSSFSLNPSKSAFFHTLTLSLLPKNHILFIVSKQSWTIIPITIVSKQCACSRRVHIEGHMNRVGLNWMLVILDNNSDKDSFGSFLSKKEHKSYLLQHNCLMIA